MNGPSRWHDVRVNEEEAERQRGIHFFVVFFVALVAGDIAAEILRNWFLGFLVTSALFLGGYRWTRSPGAWLSLAETAGPAAEQAGKVGAGAGLRDGLEDLDLADG